MGAPLAQLSPQTVSALRATLPSSLEPSNPLDCAAELTDGFATVFERGIATLAKAPEVSMIGFEADLRDDYVYLQALRDLALRLPNLTDKPCFFYSSFARANNRALGDELADRGIPCFNGAGEMLQAVTNVQEWTKRRRARPHPPQCANTAAAERWRTVLQSGIAPDEHAALDLLSTFGVPTIRSAVAENWDALVVAAASIGYPLAVKTAERGIDHKSDRGGVLLGIADQEALRRAYDDLRGRIGPRVIVQAMAGKGVELAMGCVRDPEFGPLVMISAGGTLVELFEDRQFALAPFDEQRALELIDRLAIARILDGVRGMAGKDKRSAARALSAFSVMCASLSDDVREIEVNPLIVTECGVVAVDGLLVCAEVAQTPPIKQISD
jgi:acetyltransferase